jgi:hypothetical protein
MDERRLFALAFCRECGQDYYTVWKHEKEGKRAFTPRGLSEFGSESGGRAGYLFMSTDKPWPEDSQDVLERLPDDWLEERNGEMRVKSSQRKYLPDTIEADGDGHEVEAFEQPHLAEGEARGSGDRVQPHDREDEAHTEHDQRLERVAAEPHKGPEGDEQDDVFIPDTTIAHGMVQGDRVAISYGDQSRGRDAFDVGVRPTAEAFVVRPEFVEQVLQLVRIR